MSRTNRYEAITLRTINIGEADRLCILFTKEAGRKAARARSVRKTGSKLGGTLLPFRHITVELSESEHHTTITGAVDRNDVPEPARAFDIFVRLEQGIELLLALTEDDEPLPKTFDLVFQFLHQVHTQSSLLPFQLRLLHLLGHLPENADDSRYRGLSETSQAFVRACVQISDLAHLSALNPENEELPRFVKIIAGDHLQRPLKSM